MEWEESDSLSSDYTVHSYPWKTNLLGWYSMWNLKGCHIQVNIYLKGKKRASLVAQWLRICLPMQGTRVQALVWEDPTCRRATRPMSHNY